jgi:hypothetical protein
VECDLAAIALGDDCPIALLEGGALVVALADIDSHMQGLDGN